LLLGLVFGIATAIVTLVVRTIPREEREQIERERKDREKKDKGPEPPPPAA
jgi:hypothetical protein